MENDIDGDFTALANQELGRRKDPNFDTKGLVILFEPLAVPDQEASAKEGRPMYKEVDSVKIYTPGDRFSVIHREVWPVDRQRFKDKWEAYKAGRAQPMNGTPLSAAPFLTRAQVEELKYFHCRTVEDLAGMGDEPVGRFMGMNELREKARDFIALAKDNKITSQLRALVAERDKELSNFRRIVEEMGKKVEKLTDEEPAQRGAGPVGVARKNKKAKRAA